MAFHLFKLRCDECGVIRAIRKPNSSLKFAEIVAKSKCPICHPEALNHACGGCQLPWGVVAMHSNGLCNTCVVRAWRLNRILATSSL